VFVVDKNEGTVAFCREKFAVRGMEEQVGDEFAALLDFR
jgi:hypothetical protein